MPIAIANYALLPDAVVNDGVIAIVANTSMVEGIEKYRGYYQAIGGEWVPAYQPQDAMKSDIKDLKAQVDGLEIPETLDDLDEGSTNKHFTATEKSKLSGVQAGATANASDAALVNRANHTGSQAISTISGLQTALNAKASLSHSHDPSEVTGLTAALKKLAGLKIKRAEAF